MPRRPSVAEVLLGRREFVAGPMALRKRGTAGLSNVQRRAMAPAPPRGAALEYYRFLHRVLQNVEALVEKDLLPALAEVVAPSAPMVSDPDADDAQLGARRDALSDRWARRLALLEVAITEMTSERRLRLGLEDVAEAVFNHNRREMTRVLQIDLRGSETGLGPFIRKFVAENVQLVRSVGFDQLKRMEQVVERAHAGQVRVEALAEEVKRTFEVSDSRASLIARDQTLKANAQLTQLRQQQVGVTEYIWTSSRDERVRGRPGGKWEKSKADHWALDGTRQSWLNAPVTNPETGTRNHPGEDFQCRCTASPILDHLLGR